MVIMLNGPGLLLKTVVEVDIPNPRRLAVGLPENSRLLRDEPDTEKKAISNIFRHDPLEISDSGVRLKAELFKGFHFISPIRGRAILDDAPYGFTVDPRCADIVLSIKKMTSKGYGQLLLSYSISRLMEILPDDQLGLGMEICRSRHDMNEILIPKQVCEKLDIKPGESLALSRSPSNSPIESLNFERVPNVILHMQLQGKTDLEESGDISR